MESNSYLFFNGDCEEALRFYEKTLDARIEAVMKHGGTPSEEHVPPDWRDKVLHARFFIGNSALFASDAPPGHYRAPQGFSVSVSLKDVSKGEQIFNALAENGSIQMPFAPTFWAAGFGMCVDRFGIPWMVNCEGDKQH